VIDEADECDGHVEGPTREAGDAVEALLRDRVEDAQRRERAQSLDFVDRDRRRGDGTTPTIRAGVAPQVGIAAAGAGKSVSIFRSSPPAIKCQEFYR
jgi:hypothetical protein